MNSNEREQEQKGILSIESWPSHNNYAARYNIMKENGATTSVEEGTPEGDGDSIARVGVEDCLPNFGVC